MMITEKDLLCFDEHIEIISGEPVRAANAGTLLKAYLITNIYDALRPYEKNSGVVLPFGLHYVLKTSGDEIIHAFLPAISFLWKNRLPRKADFDRPYYGAPDLAVEIASSGTLSKVRHYLRAGAEQVWVLYPSLEELHLYHRDTPKSIRVYSGEDTLEAEALFPGLKVPVKDIFVIPVE